MERGLHHQAREEVSERTRPPSFPLPRWRPRLTLSLLSLSSLSCRTTPHHCATPQRGTNVRYETVYTADGDGMGIHSTGAGFSSVDKVDFHIGSVDFETWVKWADEVKASA